MSKCLLTALLATAIALPFSTTVSASVAIELSPVIAAQVDRGANFNTYGISVGGDPQSGFQAAFVDVSPFSPNISNSSFGTNNYQYEDVIGAPDVGPGLGEPTWRNGAFASPAPAVFAEASGLVTFSTNPVAYSFLEYGFRIFTGDQGQSEDVSLSYSGFYGTELPVQDLISNNAALADLYRGQFGPDIDSSSIASSLLGMNVVQVGFQIFQSDSVFQTRNLVSRSFYTCSGFSQNECGAGSFSEPVSMLSEGQYAYGIVRLSAIASVAGEALVNGNGTFEGTRLFGKGFIDPVLSYSPSFLVSHPGATIEFSSGIGNSFPNGGVPELESWAMLLFGFGIVGSVLRVRHNRHAIPGTLRN
jgi:hypothetical protein